MNQTTGHVYVCGGMNMARDVANAIKQILVIHLGITRSQAEDYLEQLKVNTRVKYKDKNILFHFYKVWYYLFS